MENFSQMFLNEVKQVAEKIDSNTIEKMVDTLAHVQQRGGRLFILGVGGSAGHASHAVNDFRKICGIEAYAPTDNASELTARVNDEGWPTVFASYLRTSRITGTDAVMVLSVGGGNAEKNISPNIIEALKLARSVGARVLGVV